MDDAAERLGRVRPTLVDGDGRAWWGYRAVCDALRVDYRVGSKLIPPEHKRRWVQSPRDWRMKRSLCLLDRKGVEVLVIRYCRSPRWAAMAALDATAGMGRDQDRGGLDM